MSYSVLITESLHPQAIELLKSSGARVSFLKKMGKPLEEVIHEFDALIIRSQTRITNELLERAHRLKVIGRPGTGIDNVDVEAATRHGILVMNTPGQNSIAAAEHTIGILLALMRNIVPASYLLKTHHQWQRKKYLGRELAGKIVGIIGFGRIGREVARRLKAFHCHVIAYDPYVPSHVAEDAGVQLIPLETLLHESDIISLHAPLTPETEHMINSDTLKKMKDGVFLVNCARGELIHEEALYEALESGKVAGAALDVFTHEPPKSWKLIDHPKVVCTPHLGGATIEAQEKVGIQIARQLSDYFNKGIIQNAVNFPAIPTTALREYAHFLRLGKLLGCILGQLIDFRCNAVSIGFYGPLIRETVRPIVASVLEGYLQASFGETVNLINAISVAEEWGLKFKEIRHHEPLYYEHLIEIIGEGKERSLRIAGTIVHPGMARLVLIQEVFLDIMLGEHMLIFMNEDVPGVIGEIGSILAQREINIAHFSLSRRKKRDLAIGAVLIDSQPDPETIEQIAKKPFIRLIRYVHLSDIDTNSN